MQIGRSGKRGLSKKILQTVLALMEIMIVLTVAVVSMSFHRMHSVITEAEERKQDLVSDKSETTTMNLTEDSLMKTATWAADQIDTEFWILEHDFLVLGEQVKDVIVNPDHYNVLPLEDPKPENQGEYVLQLLLPEKYDRQDKDMRERMGRLANLGPMMEEIVRGNEGFTCECYISTPDGATLAMDDLSGNKYEKGSLKAYDARQRPWYKGAVEKGETFFSVPVRGYFYGREEIVFGVPIYVDGELTAVLEGATETEVLKRKLLERNIGKDSFSILINEKGQLIYSPVESGELALGKKEDDIRKSADPALAKIIDLALRGESGSSEVLVDGEKYFAAYLPLESFDWALIMFVSSEELKEPSRALVSDMEGMSDDISKYYIRLVRYTAVLLLIVLVTLTVIGQVIITAFLKKTMSPMNLMTEKIRNMTGEKSVFEVEDAFRTGDEIQLLAETIADQSERNRSYLLEIVKITSERERAEAEMAAAAKIQNAMLPKKTGPLYDMKEFEIYGEMVPAKEVGGDLYDYFLIDNDHLAVVIGDVSGKGIPAALFMVLVKNTVQSQLMLDSSDLSMVMDKVNRLLIEESVRSMFVTLWVGVLCLSDGNLKFVNAGHTLAAMRKKGGIFTIEMDEHSMVAGALITAKFTQNEIMLEEGDTIYLYTDGLTEAHNGKGEMFKTDRLLSVLNEEPALSPAELDKKVRKCLDEFTGDAEVFDDLTTLCIRFG